MEDKITIIEGPPPEFEVVPDNWVLGLNEGPKMADMALVRLRTFNGPALVQRCYNAWRNHSPIQLEYRSSDGLVQQAPIVAARTLDVEEGQMILLWMRFTDDNVELEMDYDDDQGDEEN